jgi:hypothetical protein
MPVFWHGENCANPLVPATWLVRLEKAGDLSTRDTPASNKPRDAFPQYMLTTSLELPTQLPITDLAATERHPAGTHCAQNPPNHAHSPRSNSV